MIPQEREQNGVEFNSIVRNVEITITRLPLGGHRLTVEVEGMLYLLADHASVVTVHRRAK